MAKRMSKVEAVRRLLSKGPKTVAELAKKAGLSERQVRTKIDALRARKVGVRRVGPGKFGLG